MPAWVTSKSWGESLPLSRSSASSVFCPPLCRHQHGRTYIHLPLIRRSDRVPEGLTFRSSTPGHISYLPHVAEIHWYGLWAVSCPPRRFFRWSTFKRPDTNTIGSIASDHECKPTRSLWSPSDFAWLSITSIGWGCTTQISAASLSPCARQQLGDDQEVDDVNEVSAPSQSDRVGSAGGGV